MQNKNKKTKISEPMGSQNHREYNKNKKTKISEPMGSQNHREKTTKKTRFQNQWVTKTIENITQNKKTRFQDQWFWFTIIGSEILVFLVVSVFSMVLATHWFWNLGFLGVLCILYGFCYPIYYFSRPLFALPTQMSNGMLPACSRDV